MSFNYTRSYGIKLTAAEEQLLEKIDNFKYSLQGFSDIGGIHNCLLGGVVISNQEKQRHYSYEITATECMAKTKELDAEISKINDKLSILYPQFHTQRWEAININDEVKLEKAYRIEDEIGSCERLKERLKNLKAVYLDACNRVFNGKCKIEGDTVILGEYDPLLKQVILYYNSISSEKLLAVVYVHEMMHAYLDCGGITLPEIEEPIVEYAMLNFFKAFDKSICAEAGNHVKEKQQVLGIAHYGFGYCIFKNPNSTNWREDYRNAKNSLEKTDTDVAAYLDYWKTGTYPEKKEKECMEALYKALHHGSTKLMRVKKGSASKGGASANKKGTRGSTINVNGSSRKGSRRYTINGKGPYSMYGVVEEFVMFLIDQGQTIVSINQEIQNYLNSRWIFVSSNPGKVAWSNEKGEYSSLSGFYITKQWKGNANGNFTTLIDNINQDYTSFQIVEI